MSDAALFLCVCLKHISGWFTTFCGLAGPRTTLGPAKAKRRPNKKPIKRGVPIAVPRYLLEHVSVH